MAGTQLVRCQAQAFQGAGAEIGDEDVCALQQPLQRVLALVRPQIEDDPALAAVVGLERGRAVDVLTDVPEGVPVGVTGRSLHLHHVGAPVGEHSGSGRRRHPHAQLDDGNALQWPHGPPPPHRFGSVGISQGSVG
jgi:hypothetical protein